MSRAPTRSVVVRPNRHQNGIVSYPSFSFILFHWNGLILVFPYAVFSCGSEPDLLIWQCVRHWYFLAPFNSFVSVRSPHRVYFVEANPINFPSKCTRHWLESISRLYEIHLLIQDVVIITMEYKYISTTNCYCMVCFSSTNYACVLCFDFENVF